MTKGEDFVGQIIFYDKNDILFKMGSDDDYYSKGRKETFMIAENERLIGCELDHGAKFFLGVTFIKWTI
jgi:hypothetical protein